MASLELAEVILAVIIGTLAAIVYSLRVLITMDRKIQSVEMNIQRMTNKILQEEVSIERTIKARSPKRTTKRAKKR